MKQFFFPLKWTHRKFISDSRVEVLSREISSLIPDGSAILDVGCGTGELGKRIREKNPSLSIEGVEILERGMSSISRLSYDGTKLPYEDGSFDVCLFSDVLHHAENLPELLIEGIRVSRRWILIKDHFSENRWDDFLLRVLDWFGNVPYGIACRYRYLARSQWESLFNALSIEPRKWQAGIKLYPGFLRRLLPDSLNFAVLLEKSTSPKTLAGV